MYLNVNFLYCKILHLFNVSYLKLLSINVTSYSGTVTSILCKKELSLTSTAAMVFVIKKFETK